MIVKEHKLLPAEEIVRLCERNSMAEHPFFQRLRQEPVNLTALWVFFANMEEVSHGVRRFLGHTISGIDDIRICTLFAAILNDELGEGDFSLNHTVILHRLVTALEPWKLPNATEETLSPGRELYQRTEEVFFAPDPYEGVGTLLASEVFAKQWVGCLADEIRRQNIIEPSALTWIKIHEEIEDGHAEHSLSLAHLIPKSGQALEAVWQGAKFKYKAMWDFLDGIYRITFSEDPPEHKDWMES